MIAFNAIHAEITWKLSDDGTLTISGKDMSDYEHVVITDVDFIIAPWCFQTSKTRRL